MVMGVPLLPPLGPVDINGPNAYANWDMFYQKFDLYLAATGQTSAADAVKSMALLSFLKLTQESQKFVMFSTPFGIFLYTIMLYGFAPATEESQEEVSTTFGQITNCVAYINDLIYFGDTEEHNKAVQNADTAWQWLPCHNEALYKLKSMVAQAPCLQSFEPSLPITLQCDTLQSGLGACLSQKGQPIAFASCKITVWSVKCKHLRTSHEYNSEIPRLQFDWIAVDVLEYGGKSYLVLIDAYSKWVDIMALRGKTAQDVIEACKTIFAVQRNPQILISDNLPFNLIEFSQFAQGKFQLQFSSSKYTQSNGLAEKVTQIAKQLLYKCSYSNTDYREALREYRSTLVPRLGAPSSQIMNSRLVSTHL
ncbi:hypothetical protein PR048_011746 [Dryococelus australis]|uniref:Integrase catalytic domain-containing protein n=1 Tax=Dryococelus australis TaxID=614101 RepID=A0ABQ9HNQ0_9NEOP|nr:hypothetical protein PR048_011746 [Dryococelus australis]